MDCIDPDVFLLDMRMPEIDGLGVIKNLAGQKSPVKVLVLSPYDEYHYIEGALGYGAAGYITKDEGPQAIVAAISRVLKESEGCSASRQKM